MSAGLDCAWEVGKGSQSVELILWTSHGKSRGGRSCNISRKQTIVSNTENLLFAHLKYVESVESLIDIGLYTNISFVCPFVLDVENVTIYRKFHWFICSHAPRPTPNPVLPMVSAFPLGILLTTWYEECKPHA